MQALCFPLEHEVVTPKSGLSRDRAVQHQVCVADMARVLVRALREAERYSEE